MLDSTGPARIGKDAIEAFRSVVWTSSGAGDALLRGCGGALLATYGRPSPAGVLRRAWRPPRLGQIAALPRDPLHLANETS